MHGYFDVWFFAPCMLLKYATEKYPFQAQNQKLKNQFFPTLGTLCTMHMLLHRLVVRMQVGEGGWGQGDFLPIFRGNVLFSVLVHLLYILLWLNPIPEKLRPGSIKEYIHILHDFYLFLLSVNTLMEVNEQEIYTCQVKLKNWLKHICKFFKMHAMSQKEEDLDKLLTPEEFIDKAQDKRNSNFVRNNIKEDK